MTARLCVIEGASEGTVFDLKDRIIFEVGSGDGVDCPLDDPDIVGVHLKIYRENQDFHVFDLSGRGFLVNGRRSLKHALMPGDVVTIGSHALRFENEAAAEDHTIPAPAPSSAAGPTGTQVERGGARRVELQAIKGNDTGKVYDLVAKPMHILGRGIATDITVWDIRVSRVHARVDGKDGGFFVSDLNSANGTYVNGERLEGSHELANGDYIKLGSTIFHFEEVG